MTAGTDDNLPLGTGLQPLAWNYASWRPQVDAPAPAPFDPDDCIQRFARLWAHSEGYYYDWSPCEILAPMSRQEAQFWVAAIEAFDNPPKAWENLNKQQLASRVVEAKHHEKPVSWQRFLKLFELYVTDLMEPERASLAVSLFEADEVVDKLFEELSSQHDIRHFYRFATGLAPYVVPQLSEERREKARQHLRAQRMAPHFPISPYAALAAAFGLHDEIRDFLAQFEDGAFKNQPAIGHVLVFGLDDPDLVLQEHRRLGLHMSEPWHIKGWLAHHGLTQVATIQEDLTKIARNKVALGPVLSTLTRGDAPELAPLFMDAMLKTQLPAPARKWLSENPRATVLGLSHLAGNATKAGQAATDVLKVLASRQPEAVQACLGDLPKNDAERLRKNVLEAAPAIVGDPDAEIPEPLAKAFSLLPKTWQRKRPPKWIEPATLPPLIADGALLGEKEVKSLLIALREKESKARDSLLKIAAKYVDTDALDAFVLKLYDLWTIEGWPGKDKWILVEGLGRLGGERCVLELMPKLEVWRKETKYQRVQQGVDAAVAIAGRQGPGADMAVMHFDRILRTTKRPSLRRQANQAIQDIANARGITRAELEDRAVPTLELGQNGVRVFDFGPRQFQFVLGPDMKAGVRDEKGKIRANPPKPAKKDDPVLAPKSAEEWKLFKKQVTQILKIQIRRLEHAMVQARRWPLEDFRAYLWQHPLMTHLTRRVLWGLYNDDKVVGTFRSTEEGEIVDLKDEPFELQDNPSLGIVHPLTLDENDREAWAAIFADYDIIPPFPQLDRRVHHLQPEEENETALTRFCGKKIASETLLFGLERLGWHHAPLGDGMWVSNLQKPFYGYSITAVAEGAMDASVIVSGQAAGTPGQIDQCQFVAGLFHQATDDEDWHWRNPPQPLPLSEVPPVVLSEVLADLEVMANR